MSRTGSVATPMSRSRSRSVVGGGVNSRLDVRRARVEMSRVRGLVHELTKWAPWQGGGAGLRGRRRGHCPSSRKCLRASCSACCVNRGRVGQVGRVGANASQRSPGSIAKGSKMSLASGEPRSMKTGSDAEGCSVRARMLELSRNRNTARRQRSSPRYSPRKECTN